MATEADVLRSISTIMEGGLRREEAKVQTALAMMQFAQQKRMQEISLTQSNLDLVSKSVQQQKPQVASEFLSSSGLGGIYQEGEEGEPAMDSIEKMAKTLRTKQYFGRGIDTNQAQSMAAAVWNYYSAEDPNAVLKLATDLHDANALANDRQLVGSMSRQQQKLYEAFANLHNQKDLSDLTQSAKKARQAEAQVSKEIFDFTKGDYDISDLSGIYEGIPEALQEIDIQEEIDSQPASSQQIEMDTTRRALRDAEGRLRGLQNKMDANVATDEEKEEFYELPNLIERFQSELGESSNSLIFSVEQEIKDLNKKIQRLKDEGLASTRKYREIKRMRYQKRGELIDLVRKRSSETLRKREQDRVEEISELLEVSESEAREHMESQKTWMQGGTTWGEM